MKSSPQYASKDSNQKSRLLKMTQTLMLITLNEQIFFAIPDFLLVLEYHSFAFYVMNMNKGNFLIYVSYICYGRI